MNALAQWQLANDRYLADRLAWLRQRFADCLGARGAGEIAFEPASSDASTRLEESPRSSELQPALSILGQRLGLSAFEQEILLLCTATELDPRIPELCARAQGDSHRAYPTFALAMTLFEEPAWDAMSPERPLRRLRLVEINQPGATPLTTAALRADERILHFIKGLNYLDERLTPLLLPLDARADTPLPPSQDKIASRITDELLQHAGARQPLVELAGPDRAGKQLVAAQVASACGLDLVRLPAEMLPSDFGELETLLVLWEREQRLLPLALYVDAYETEATVLDRPSSSLARFLARTGGHLFLDVADVHPLSGQSLITAEVAKPTPLEQRELWRQSLGSDEETATALAGQFSLNAPAIERLVRAHAKSAESLWDACRRATRPRLETLARRIDAKATWDDLVLPAEELTQLRAIAAQVRQRGRVYDDWGFRARHNRGLGISVLFAGESGTGKTMAAEVIARDLQLDLYRIDLSAVVNKYIGETEKNLRRLFDAADDGGAILLFDEADALFGKRTEVKDSHDRYANLEVNYLLQRMESYRGLAILATNLKSSLDRAFLRRLRFVVDFPVPEAQQRRALWKRAFPADTPLANLDYERLAKLNITGGNIHTIALNAAFAAADSAVPVTMRELLSATQQEYRKLQKPVIAADFRLCELEGSLR